MSMFSKGKGLFGAPMMPAGGTFAPDGVSSSPAAAALAPSTETYQAPKRTFLDKLGLVADAFRGTHENSDMLQMQDDRAYQNWQRTAGAQLARANEFADWERRQNWELQHPKAQAEDNFTRTLRNAGIDPASPEAMTLYRQKAMTDASPAPNFVSDGAGGGRWVTPPAASLMPPGGAPTAPVGRLTPLGAGGATPQGARTFPVR